MITRLKFLNSNTVAASCVLIWDGPCVQVVGFLAPVFPWPVMMGLRLNPEVCQGRPPDGSENEYKTDYSSHSRLLGGR